MRNFKSCTNKQKQKLLQTHQGRTHHTVQKLHTVKRPKPSQFLKLKIQKLKPHDAITRNTERTIRIWNPHHRYGFRKNLNVSDPGNNKFNARLKKHFFKSLTKNLNEKTAPNAELIKFKFHTNFSTVKIQKNEHTWNKFDSNDSEPALEEALHFQSLFHCPGAAGTK